jgi:hypothetical protein
MRTNCARAHRHMRRAYVPPFQTKKQKRRERTAACWWDELIHFGNMEEIPGERTVRVEDEFATTVQEEFLAFLDKYVFS